jgi:hypothetical protein
MVVAGHALTFLPACVNAPPSGPTCAEQLWYNPYRCPRMDALERLSLYGNTILIYVSLFFMLDLGEAIGMVLTALLLGINGLILVW